MWRDDARVLDIVLACTEALEFTRGVSHEGYLRDRKLQRALCMVLEIIGEAARAVSEEYKALHPEVPWKELAGLRNRIVHEYFRLDLNLIWDIVHTDVPALLAQLEPLVPPEGET